MRLNRKCHHTRPSKLWPRPWNLRANAPFSRKWYHTKPLSLKAPATCNHSAIRKIGFASECRGADVDSEIQFASSPSSRDPIESLSTVTSAVNFFIKGKTSFWPELYLDLKLVSLTHTSAVKGSRAEKENLAT